MQTETKGDRPEAKRAFSQNFLRDPDVLARMGDAASELAAPSPEATVCVEIGPGTGQLTEVLLARGLRVAAVEADPRMESVLTQRFGERDDLLLEIGDARETDLTRLAASLAGTPCPPVLGISNLPYQYTTPLMTRYFVSFPDARGFLFMVQRDAVSRLRSLPGGITDKKRRGPVRILGEAYGTADVLCRVPPQAFDPPPRVASSVLRFRPHGPERRARCRFYREAPAFFAAYLDAAFTQRRRTVANNFKLDAARRGRPFASLTASARAEISERFGGYMGARPEALSVDAHLELAEAICRLSRKETP